MGLTISDDAIETALTYVAQLHINKSGESRNSVLHVLTLFGITDEQFNEAVEKRKLEIKQFDTDLKLLRNGDVDKINVPKYIGLAGYCMF